jgi:hypothetical protein
MKSTVRILLVLLVVVVTAALFFQMRRQATMASPEQPPGFMAFTNQEDCERYCDTAFTTDSQPVKSLFDAGHARYMTEIAAITVLERYPGKKCVEVRWEDDPTPLYISAMVAKKMGH